MEREMLGVTWEKNSQIKEKIKLPNALQILKSSK